MHARSCSPMTLLSLSTSSNPPSSSSNTTSTSSSTKQPASKNQSDGVRWKIRLINKRFFLSKKCSTSEIWINKNTALLGAPFALLFFICLQHFLSGAAVKNGEAETYKELSPFIDHWRCLALRLNLFQYIILYLYIYIYHTWKKVGILATGCRRYGAKNDAKWQKTT